MKIKLNGEERLIDTEIILYNFIINQLNGKEPNGIAVALNEMIIPKQKWESVTVKENDAVEIVHAVQGG